METWQTLEIKTNKTTYTISWLKEANNQTIYKMEYDNFYISFKTKQDMINWINAKLMSCKEDYVYI